MMYKLATKLAAPVLLLVVVGSIIGAAILASNGIRPYVPLFALVGCIVLPFALCAFDKVFKTQVSCATFGWHSGQNGPHSFDGCSPHAVCSKCGREVMQDGQGNWF